MYVTGASRGGPLTGSDIATVAYDVVAGTRLWVERWTGTKKQGRDVPAGLAVNPNGTGVYVAGVSDAGSPKTKEDMITLSYAA